MSLGLIYEGLGPLIFKMCDPEPEDVKEGADWIDVGGNPLGRVQIRKSRRGIGKRVPAIECIRDELHIGRHKAVLGCQ